MIKISELQRLQSGNKQDTLDDNDNQTNIAITQQTQHYSSDNVEYETDSNNNISAEYTYDACGNILSKTWAIFFIPSGTFDYM